MTDHDLERRVRHSLREALDRELGPDPTWADSSAARRVAEMERRARRRWPLRVLAVAALIAATGGAAALLGGGLSEVPPPEALASPLEASEPPPEALASPLEASEPPPEALASPLELSGVTNGWIAFSVSEPGLGDGEDDLDIWLAALDQEARRVIGTDTDDVDQLCPAFSPDGRSLAYGRVEGDGTSGGAQRLAAYRNAALVVADVSDDGHVADRLTIDVGDELPPPCPVWSPDGDRLAFGVPRTSPINPDRSGDGSEVWVVRLSDRDVTVLPDVLATDLDWSPDGSLLAIVGGVETASGEGVRDGLQDARIHLYTPSSATMRSLEDTLGASSLTWAPDGGRIAYVRGAGLWAIDVETGQHEALAPPFHAIHGIGPVWSPDGESIVYQRQTSGERHEVVLVMPGDISGETGLPTEVVIPSFRTTADGSGSGLYPYRVTWSPDSKYLLYLAWSVPANAELAPLVVVPTDLNAPSVLLAGMDGIVAYDGYPDTTFVPIQTWGRQPPD